MNKWMPAGLGAEPKKVIFLGALLVLLPVIYFWNQEPSTPVVATAPRPSTLIPTPPAAVRTTPRPAQRAKSRGINEDFHPTLKLPEDFDLSKVDPTLRTDLLARVRQVGEAGGSRSLFEFYTPPPPPPPPQPKILPTPPKPIDLASSKPAEPPKPAGPPPPPPIPLKYYGYEGTPRGGKMRALFIDGDETFVRSQGEMIRNRYRIARIGTTSAEVEDTVAKNTQTLRIMERCEDSTSCK